MNLNLSVVFDLFPPCPCSLHASSSTKLYLKGIRLLPEHPAAVSPEHLYLAPGRLNKEFQNYTGMLNLVYIDPEHTGILEKHENWNYILVEQSMDQTLLFKELQDIFDQFHRWNERLLQAVLQRHSLQEILDIGSEYLSNPLVLFDISFKYIAATKTDGMIPSPDSIWKYVLQYKYSPIDRLSPADRISFYRKLETADSAFLMNAFPPFQDDVWMIAPIFYQKNMHGFMASTNLYDRHSNGQLSIITHLQTIIGAYFALGQNNTSTYTDMPYIITQMLSGYMVEKGIVDFHLQKTGWKPYAPIQILYICPRLRTEEEQFQSKYLISRLMNYFPDAIIFPYENAVVLILPIQETQENIFSISIHNNDFQCLLSDMNLSAGVSMSLHSFMHIKYAYIQAKAALKEGIRMDGSGKCIFYFEDYYEKYLLSSLDSVTGLKCLCHPRMLEAKVSGHLTDDLLKTLLCYLSNGGNLSRTADMLYIHRNTLMYRIERIENLLQIKLKKLNTENQFLILYLSCMILRSDSFL